MKDQLNKTTYQLKNKAQASKSISFHKHSI